MTSADHDARFWNRIARKYARDPIKDMAGYERTLSRTLELLAPSDTVLEIGCGTGTTALRIAPRVARIVATDVADAMIAIAREKADAAGCRNVDFRVAPADRTPGEEGAFDAVLAFNLLHLMADRGAVLREACSALKPGGLLISKTPCLTDLNILLRAAIPAMRLVGLAPFVAVFPASTLESEVAAAGFAIEERARHGTDRKDIRIFLVARKTPAAGG